MDVYCKNKFNYLKIDTDHKTFYNCHAALPHPVDLDWLEKNPGNLFNNPIIVKEREEMLQGLKNKSCSYQCYRLEEIGHDSVRTQSDQTNPIKDLICKVETLDIALGTDCNLTCVYCSGNYSSAWRRDLSKNGEYDIDNSDDAEQKKFKETGLQKKIFKVLDKVSQKEKLEVNKRFFNLMHKEFDLIKSDVKKLILTGGEPLLNLEFEKIVKKFKDIDNIIIFSGLGVSYSKFKNRIDFLSQFKNVTIEISNESIEEYFEFNRYGSTWKDFLQKIDYMKKKVQFQFACTISNTVVLNLHRFINFCLDNDYKFKLKTHVSYPLHMRINVLDEESKKICIENLKKYNNIKGMTDIIKALTAPQHKTDRKNCAVYLKEFSRRRNLNLNIFPESFIKWLNEKE
jgi:MoaA/NifB/PqqE/SkfB family radical SAM enzyme